MVSPLYVSFLAARILDKKFVKSKNKIKKEQFFVIYFPIEILTNACKSGILFPGKT